MNAQNVRSNSGSKLARKIQQWQIQRLTNVQAVIDEYNQRGWNQQETLRQINHSINDDVSEDGGLHATKMEQLKEDYKTTSISAKDIILPPFKENLTAAQIETQRQEYINSQKISISEESKQQPDLSRSTQ